MMMFSYTVVIVNLRLLKRGVVNIETRALPELPASAAVHFETVSLIGLKITK